MMLTTMDSEDFPHPINEALMITIERFDEPAHCCELDTDTEKPWYHEVKRYLEEQEYSEGASINDKVFTEIFSQILFK